MNLSLIEILVSTAVGAVMLVAVLSLFNSTTSAMRGIEKKRQEVEFLTSLHEMSQRAILNYDSHRLPLSLRIHKNGVIRRTDRVLNDVMRHAVKTRRPSGSDAVTSIALDVGMSLRVHEARRAGSTQRVELRACSLGGGAIPGYLLQNLREWAVVSFSATAELVITSGSAVGPKCARFVGSLVPSMSLRPPEDLGPAKSWALLIPIVAHGTLYLDESGQLRVLGHRGARNIENQPISPPIDGVGMRFSWWSSAVLGGGDLEGLEVRATIHSQERLKEVIPSRLGRLSQVSHLLHLAPFVGEEGVRTSP